MSLSEFFHSAGRLCCFKPYSGLYLGIYTYIWARLFLNTRYDSKSTKFVKSRLRSIMVSNREKGTRHLQSFLLQGFKNSTFLIN